MIEIREQYYENGSIYSKEHYINGVLHREDWSAVIHYFPNSPVYYEAYYINGSLHRENGPAHIEYDYYGNIRYKSYWINDVELTKEEWYKQLSVETKLKIAFNLFNEWIIRINFNFVLA